MVSFDIKNSQLLEAYRNKLALDGRMTEPPRSCQFAPELNTGVNYACLRNEVCCEHGCCITSFRRMAQFWYFWVILFFIFIAFMACMHYYKRMKEDRADRAYQRNHRQHRLMAEELLRSHRVLYRRPEEYRVNFPSERCVRADVHHQRADLTRPNYESLDERDGGEINDFLLEQLFVTYRNNRGNSFVSGLPPDYSSLEKDQVHVEPPPKYSVACQLLGDSSADLQANIIGNQGGQPRDAAQAEGSPEVVVSAEAGPDCAGGQADASGEAGGGGVPEPEGGV